jgi:hypothetical protein
MITNLGALGSSKNQKAASPSRSAALNGSGGC